MNLMFVVVVEDKEVLVASDGGVGSALVWLQCTPPVTGIHDA